MNIFYILLAALALFMTVKNVMQMQKYKGERKFVDIYSEVLNEAEGVNEKLETYIQNEKKDNLKNKARVLLVYTMLGEGKDVDELIESIDLSSLLYTNGRFDIKEACHNSDVFIWFALAFARAARLKKNKIIEPLAKKALEFDDALNNLLEYNMFKGYYAIMAKKKEEDNFLNKMLDGDYSGMYYEKRLIALYKRIAASFLVYDKQKIDEFFENDLHEFGGKLLGQLLLKELEIYDKYKPLNETEENKEIEAETKEEEKKETKKVAKKATTKTSSATKKVTKKAPVKEAKKTVKKKTEKK